MHYASLRSQCRPTAHTAGIVERGGNGGQNYRLRPRDCSCWLEGRIDEGHGGQEYHRTTKGARVGWRRISENGGTVRPILSLIFPPTKHRGARCYTVVEGSWNCHPKFQSGWPCANLCFFVEFTRHGYLTCRSTLKNLLVIEEVVAKWLEKGRAVDLVYFNFSKAIFSNNQQLLLVYGTTPT